MIKSLELILSFQETQGVDKHLITHTHTHTLTHTHTHTLFELQYMKLRHKEDLKDIWSILFNNSIT